MVQTCIAEEEVKEAIFNYADLLLEGSAAYHQENNENNCASAAGFAYGIATLHEAGSPNSLQSTFKPANTTVPYNSLSYFLGTDCLNALCEEDEPMDELCRTFPEDGNADFHEPGFMLNRAGGGWSEYTVDFDDWTILTGEQYCESPVARGRICWVGNDGKSTCLDNRFDFVKMEESSPLDTLVHSSLRFSSHLSALARTTEPTAITQVETKGAIQKIAALFTWGN